MDGEKVVVSLATDLSLRIVDGHMYIKMDNTTLNVETEEVNEYSREELDRTIERMKLIEGKWLDIPLMGEDMWGASSYVVGQGFTQQQAMLEVLVG